MKRGWFKCWRCITDSEIFFSPKLTHFFIWCLRKAAYEETTVTLKVKNSTKTVKLRAGQFIFGRDSAAAELHCPPSRARNLATSLKSLGILDIKADSNFSIVSIINWDKYQSEKKISDSRTDSRTDTKKKFKNYKEKEREATDASSSSSSSSRASASKNLKTKLPDDFTLTDALRQFAISKGVDDPEKCFETFRDDRLSKGCEYTDWDAAFRKWVRSWVGKQGPAKVKPPTFFDDEPEPKTESGSYTPPGHAEKIKADMLKREKDKPLVDETVLQTRRNEIEKMIFNIGHPVDIGQHVNNSAAGGNGDRPLSLRDKIKAQESNPKKSREQQLAELRSTHPFTDEDAAEEERKAREEADGIKT
jgi:hypothetical protein